MADRVKEARRSLTELVDCGHDNGYSDAELSAALDVLVAAVREDGSRDTERLDWMETEGAALSRVVIYGAYRWTAADLSDRNAVRGNNHATLRAAIDAALQNKDTNIHTLGSDASTNGGVR